MVDKWAGRGLMTHRVGCVSLKFLADCDCDGPGLQRGLLEAVHAVIRGYRGRDFLGGAYEPFKVAAKTVGDPGRLPLNYQDFAKPAGAAWGSEAVVEPMPHWVKQQATLDSLRSRVEALEDKDSAAITILTGRIEALEKAVGEMPGGDGGQY